MIAILLTSTLLTMLGIAGVLMGTYNLQSGPLPENLHDLFPPEEPDTPSEADIRERELRVQLLEAQVTNPYRRPMAAANIVVSALVLIGSFMLSWRRKLSQWWIRQAVTAKVIWIVSYTGTLVYHLDLVFPAMPAASAGGVTRLISEVILWSTLSAALHVGAAWRASRRDISDFIEKASKS
jgi:hypothetical protein